jgi:Uma2 family endonuclease
MESGLACLVITFLVNYVREHDLGLVTGEAGTLRLMPGLVRIPDVAFISFQQIPSRTWHTEPIPDLVPDLAVEVLSPSNTPGEMQRKLKDYFLSGVRLAWFIDPQARTGSIYTAPDQARTIGENESLDGGEVLPGYALPLSQVFAHLPARTDAKPTRRSRKR